MQTNQLANRFRTFAKQECKGSSPLYEYLSLKIAENSEVLELSAYAKEGQPIPNLLFGAVHFLLLQENNNHPLQAYYPSIVDNPRKVEDAFLPFKDFCEQHWDQLITILETKLVQTNEVRRCGYLFPSFSFIHRKAGKPLALIEIGTSAGLQLLWDKYRYAYNVDGDFGEPESEVFIQSEVIGGNVPPAPFEIPPVTSRVGLDLHINDVTDPENFLWLNALIWPEHEDRRKLFKQAASCMKRHRNAVELVEGDGVELLPEIAADIPRDAAICIFHTHVANQIPVETKRELQDHVRRISKTRDVFHLYNNMWDAELHLDSFLNGVEENEIIGKTDGHGRWFEWRI